MKGWIDRMLGRSVAAEETERAAVDAHVEDLVSRLAERKGISRSEIREQARRRATLQIEADSYRRGVR